MGPATGIVCGAGREPYRPMGRGAEGGAGPARSYRGLFGIKATSLILTCTAAIAGAGCASSPSIPAASAAAAGAGARADLVVIGDWNDVEAAAIAGVDQNETVIVAQHHTDREQVFELQTIMDERGTLTA